MSPCSSDRPSRGCRRRDRSTGRRRAGGSADRRCRPRPSASRTGRRHRPHSSAPRNAGVYSRFLALAPRNVIQRYCAIDAGACARPSTNRRALLTSPFFFSVGGTSASIASAARRRRLRHQAGPLARPAPPPVRVVPAKQLVAAVARQHDLDVLAAPSATPETSETARRRRTARRDARPDGRRAPRRRASRSPRDARSRRAPRLPARTAARCSCRRQSPC